MSLKILFNKKFVKCLSPLVKVNIAAIKGFGTNSLIVSTSENFEVFKEIKVCILLGLISKMESFDFSSLSTNLFAIFEVKCFLICVRIA